MRILCQGARGLHCALACPVALGHVKLRLAGATPWASGAIAYNGTNVYEGFAT